MKVKTIPVRVYRQDRYDATNGGASGLHDELYLEHPRGFIEIEADDERLFRVGVSYGGHPLLIPMNPIADGAGPMVGPMMGGNYAASPDTRFYELIRLATGRDFYGAVAIHDRYETPEQYDLLSR